MNNKKLVTATLIICAAALSLWFGIKKNSDSDDIKQVSHEEQSTPYVSEDGNNLNSIADKNKRAPEEIKNGVKQASVQIDDSFIKRANLYNSDSVIPLSAISIVSSLPQNIQDKVSSIVSSNNVFMAKKSGDKLLIITDNPNNIRHCVEFIEISLKNGHQTKTTFGYNDKMKDSDNDIWEYDENTKQPTRHSKYNADGDIEFVETWNYDGNPIKYEMKDANNKVISMRKETLDGGTNLRVEHLIYDKAGNTKVSISTMYDGADVTRFTYYNADKPLDGGSVFIEYSDGLNTKETVYSNDLKIVNTYTSEYKDGNREDITKWDNKNQEVHKYLPDEEAL